MTLPSRQFLIQQATLCAMEERRPEMVCLTSQGKTLAESFDAIYQSFPDGQTMKMLHEKAIIHFHRLLAEAEAREISAPRAML